LGKTSDSVPAGTGKRPQRVCTKALAKALGYTGPTKPSKTPRTSSGKSTGGKRVAGKRSVSIKKATPVRTVKSVSTLASSRQKEKTQSDEEILTGGGGDTEDEDEEESDTKQSQEAEDPKQVSLPMYMLPKEGEGDKKPVTGPGGIFFLVEKKGREVRLLHINDMESDTRVWKRFETREFHAWVLYMDVPPAKDVKSDKEGQQLLRIGLYDLVKATENKSSRGLFVPEDMVEIINICTKEVMMRAGDLNTFSDSVMAAGGPKLRDKNYDYGAK